MSESADPLDPFDHAVALHQAGRLDEAEDLYRELLRGNADDSVVLNLLGAVRLARGDADEARALLARSVAIDPDDPTAWLHLAEAELSQDRGRAALDAWIRAARTGFEELPLRSRLGTVLEALCRSVGRDEVFRRCADLDDETLRTGLQAWITHLAAPEPREYLEANEALRGGDLAAAEQGYREAIAAHPDHPESLLNLGGVLAVTDRAAESEEMLRRAVAAAPSGRSQAALGGTLGRLGRHEEAIELLEHAVREDPDLAEAWINLGESLAAVQRHDEAVPVARRAIELAGDRAEAWKSFAGALEFRDPKASIAAAEEALRRRPDLADAEMIRAQSLLRLGEFQAGWRAYEARWRVRDAPSRRGRRPIWHGGPLPVGESLLVTGEQGVGDEVMFATMLPDAERRFGPGVLECDPRLAALLSRSLPTWRVIAGGGPIPENTRWEIPIGSLAGLVRGDADSFGAGRPLLVPDEATQTAFAEMIASRLPGRGPLVGISWNSVNPRLGPAKSLPLASLAESVAAAGARLVDLQYDSTVEARERLRADTGIDLLQIDECDRRRDLDGLASLISTLDGVVSIDNTTIHLAGGLGIPSMVLLPFGSDWRWTLDRDRSLWYPSVRTARQRQPGDWNGPLAEAARFVQGLGTA